MSALRTVLGARMKLPRLASWGLWPQLVSIVVLAGLLSGVILTTTLLQSNRESIRQTVYEGNLNAADVAAEFAGQYLDGTETVLREVASRPELMAAVMAGTPELIQPQLAHLL